MSIGGSIRDGVVIPDQPLGLPNGTRVQIETHCAETPPTVRPKRLGGQWRGQVHIADDFDGLPGDIAAAFGMRDE